MAKSNVRHFDAFTGVSYAVVYAVNPLNAANDVGGPFDDGIRSETTRAASRANALASLDVLTPANWAAYAALASV